MQSGKQKVAQICELLKEKTIEPAQVEAKRIIEEAKEKAEKILLDADAQNKARRDRTDLEIEKKKRTFDSSLKLSCSQGIEQLRQTILEGFFSKELEGLIEKSCSDKDIITNIINSVIEGIQKEGIESDSIAYISDKIDKKEIVGSILKKFIDRVKVEGKEEIKGGATIKIVDQNLLIDISDEAIKDLIVTYIHEDFRQIIFAL